MELLWARLLLGLQLCVRYASAFRPPLQPCGRWLLTMAVCVVPVQLSSNSRMSDIDSESVAFFNDSPKFALFLREIKKRKIKNWNKNDIRIKNINNDENKTTREEIIHFLLFLSFSQMFVFLLVFYKLKSRKIVLLGCVTHSFTIAFDNQCSRVVK